jgi:hypothetical protein
MLDLSLDQIAGHIFFKVAAGWAVGNPRTRAQEAIILFFSLLKMLID